MLTLKKVLTFRNFYRTIIVSTKSLTIGRLCAGKRSLIIKEDNTKKDNLKKSACLKFREVLLNG